MTQMFWERVPSGQSGGSSFIVAEQPEEVQGRSRIEWRVQFKLTTAGSSDMENWAYGEFERQPRRMQRCITLLDGCPARGPSQPFLKGPQADRDGALVSSSDRPDNLG